MQPLPAHKRSARGHFRSRKSRTQAAHDHESSSPLIKTCPPNTMHACGEISAHADPRGQAWELKPCYPGALPLAAPKDARTPRVQRHPTLRPNLSGQSSRMILPARFEEGGPKDSVPRLSRNALGVTKRLCERRRWGPKAPAPREHRGQFFWRLFCWHWEVISVV